MLGVTTWNLPPLLFQLRALHPTVFSGQRPEPPYSGAGGFDVGGATSPSGSGRASAPTARSRQSRKQSLLEPRRRFLNLIYVKTSIYEPGPICVHARCASSPPGTWQVPCSSALLPDARGWLFALLARLCSARLSGPGIAEWGSLWAASGARASSLRRAGSWPSPVHAHVLCRQESKYTAMGHAVHTNLPPAGAWPSRSLQYIH